MFTSAATADDGDDDDGGSSLEFKNKQITETYNPLYNMAIKKCLVSTPRDKPLDLQRKLVIYGARQEKTKKGKLKPPRIPHDRLTDEQKHWCREAGIRFEGDPEPEEEPAEELQSANVKKLAGADVEFEAPDFDDVDVDIF